MKWVLLATILFLVACSASTDGSPSLTCEQRFDRALQRGVPYAQALGDYTQCLIGRGDTVKDAVSL